MPGKRQAKSTTAAAEPKGKKQKPEIEKLPPMEEPEEEVEMPEKTEKSNPKKRGAAPKASTISKGKQQKKESEEPPEATTSKRGPKGKTATNGTSKNGSADAKPDEDEEKGAPPPKRAAKTAAAAKLVEEKDSGDEHEENDEPKSAPPKRAAKKVAAAKLVEEKDSGDEQEEDEEPKPAPPKRGAKKAEEKKTEVKRGGKAKNAQEVEKIIDTETDETAGEKSSESNTDDEAPEGYETNRTTEDGRKSNLKIAAWNVAGIRSWIKKTEAKDYLKNENPDILLICETKCSLEEMPAEAKNVSGYESYFQSSTGGKKGYAGVGLYSKNKPLNVKFGLGVEEHDKDGRMLTAEYDDFYLVGVYVPNSSRKLVNLEKRRRWNKDFLAYLKKLDALKPVVVCGDLNVAHNEIDLASPKTNTRNAGFTKEERDDFSEWLNSGFVDTFRRLYPKKTGAYTFWSNLGGSRAKNIGWRLDYFVVSERFGKNVCDSVIRSQVKGSDHCPLALFVAL